MVLLHLLRWLKNVYPELKADVLTLKGGGLTMAFKDSCDAFYDYSSKQSESSLVQKLLYKLKLLKPIDRKKRLLNTLSDSRYDMIYANTVVSLPVAQAILKRSGNTKLLAHLHELPAVIMQLLPDLDVYLKDVDQVIVPSRLVLTQLSEHWSIDESLVEVVYACSDVEVVSANKKPSSVFTVGASGTVHWRKGQDIFVQLSRYITKHYPDMDLCFVWVGHIPKKERVILMEDIRKLGLQEKVKFVGEVENPTPYYEGFDVFVMTSREDPFPLVCIEVGLLGKPIVSFDQATGTNEILRQNGGFIVPYMDIEAMAEKIVSYYHDSELKELHGAYNKQTFSQFTPELICPQLFEVIQTVLK